MSCSTQEDILGVERLDSGFAQLLDLTDRGMAPWLGQQRILLPSMGVLCLIFMWSGLRIFNFVLIFIILISNEFQFPYLLPGVTQFESQWLSTLFLF